MTGLHFLADATGKGFWMPPAASEFAENVDSLFSFILWISVFFFVLLIGITAYFAVKYKASPTHTRSSPVSHHFSLEFLWSAIPSVLLVVMFVWGLSDYTALSATPNDALQIRVVGKKWSWEVRYPKLDRVCLSENNAETLDNTVDFYVPVGQPFTVQLSSEDVLHSFWIPAFRVKRDVLPNRYTGYTVTPTAPGTYPVFCAEYCGDSHSHMRGNVHVLTQAEWENDFLKGDKCKEITSGPEYGASLFKKQGCNACHSTAAGVRIVGPSLFGIAGHDVETTSGTVKADDAYIRESIEEPQKQIVKGFEGINMPAFKGRLTEPELAALIDYLKTLHD